MDRRVLAVPQLIEMTLLLLLLVHVIGEILVFDARTRATEHALVAPHLLAFLVQLSTASSSGRIFCALALLLSVDGARLRPRVVRRVQVAWMTISASSSVWLLVLDLPTDLLVHGLLPLVRGAAVAAADVAVSILSRVRRLSAVVIWVTLIDECGSHGEVRVLLLRRVCLRIGTVTIGSRRLRGCLERLVVFSVVSRRTTIVHGLWPRQGLMLASGNFSLRRQLVRLALDDLRVWLQP